MWEIGERDGATGAATRDPTLAPDALGRLVVPVLGLLIVAIIAVAGLLLLAARSQDRAAAEQARAEVEAVVRLSLERLSKTAEDYASWNEAVTNLVVTPDTAWAAANVGENLATSFGVRRVIAVGFDGAPLLGLEMGHAVEGARLEQWAAVTVPLARAVAAQGTGGNAVGVVQINGEAHLAAASDLTPRPGSGPPERRAALIFLRPIDTEFITEIDDILPVRQLMISGAVEPGSEAAALALKNVDGTIGATLTWSPPAPARGFLGNSLFLVLPVLVAMIVLTAIFLVHAHGVATERLQMASDLASSETKLRLLYDNLPDLVGLLRFGRIELVNAGGSRLLGVDDPTDLVGRRLVDLVAPSDRDRVAARLADPSSRNDVMACNMVTADGSPRSVDLWFLPIAEEAEDAALVIARDRQEQEEAKESLRLALAQAAIADYAKGQFLSNVSQELRTPLNAIIGFSQILADGLARSGDSQYQAFARDIHEGGLHLLRLVDDLLDLARIDAGSLDLREGWVDIQALADRCFTAVAARAASAGVQVAVDVAVKGDRLLADESRLKMAVVNLLQNAIRASRSGDVVTLCFRRGLDGDLCIQVGDRGPGMTPEQVDLALTPFSQLGDLSGPLQRGIGLGLPLAKGYAEAHEGDLTISSTPGVGTSITLRLPPSRFYAPDFSRS